MGQFWRFDLEEKGKGGPASAEEVREAIKKGAKLMPKTICGTCAGSRQMDCMGCMGSGTRKSEDPDHPEEKPCTGCGGTGKKRCTNCSGSGRVKI